MGRVLPSEDDMQAVVPGLKERQREPELMDNPSLEAGLHHAALVGLARVNRWSASTAVVWKEIRPLAQEFAGRALRVLDVACGGGDSAISLARRAKRAAIPMSISGCDISPVALDHAMTRNNAAGTDVSFFQADVLQDRLPEGFDVICCSLFLHHLDESDVVALLTSMHRAAGRMTIISDLIRSRRGLLLAWCGVRLLTRSRICHVDGPRSVRAAFTPEEVLQLAKRSGMSGVRLASRWPQRFLLTWKRA